jgi:hypothetical protein
MWSKIRSSLTYANVIATLALFLALGGGAYAAFKLPKNSVGSKQLKTNAVNSSKVKNGSLLAGDFKAGQLPVGAQGVQGIQGIQGIQGLTGDTGAVGPTAGATDPGSGNPSATFNVSTVSATITTKASSKLVVMGSVRSDVVCASTGPCTRTWGLYVDGTPVPGSAYPTGADASSSDDESVATTGITGTLPPGTHTAALRAADSGHVANSHTSIPRVTVIALGG